MYTIEYVYCAKERYNKGVLLFRIETYIATFRRFSGRLLVREKREVHSF